MKPQILMLVLFSIALGIDISKHGEPKTGTNNCIIGIIAIGIQTAILWWGGFWDVFIK
jgi:hypothetical protein